MVDSDQSINNLIYVVILSAAVDLVGAEVPKGVVLLANITPSLIIKTIAPYFIHRVPYPVRVLVCASLSLGAVVLIAMAQTITVRLLGVAMASLSSGLGEMTFLMLSSFYHVRMVSAWSSGTGGAGLLGALLFLALTSWFGLSVPRTLGVVAMFPILMLVAYFFLLTGPTSHPYGSARYRPIAPFSPSTQALLTNADNGQEEEELLESPRTVLQPRPTTLETPATGPSLAALSSAEYEHEGDLDKSGSTKVNDDNTTNGDGVDGDHEALTRNSSGSRHDVSPSVRSSRVSVLSPSITVASQPLPGGDQESISSTTLTTGMNSIVLIGSASTSASAPAPAVFPLAGAAAAPWDNAAWDVPQHRTEPTSINTLLAATDPDDPRFVSPFREADILEEDGSSLSSSTRDGERQRRRMRRVYYVVRPNEAMSLKEKLGMARALLAPFMVPLFMVYVAEYTMNQGVLPVILFPLEKTPFNHMRDHYVTYSAIYQLGVFISRSSASVLHISRLWIPSFLQTLTLTLAITQALLSNKDNGIPIPSVYLIFGLILWEGLLGGATYVHAYIGISKDFEHDPKAKEFALGVVGVADGLGILVAGVASLWIEPALCRWQVLRKGVELCLSMAD